MFASVSAAVSVASPVDVVTVEDRIGRVRESDGNVENVPRPQDNVDPRLSKLVRRQNVPPLTPPQRVRPPPSRRGSVYSPPLAPGGLEYKNVLTIRVRRYGRYDSGGGQVYVGGRGKAEGMGGDPAQRSEPGPQGSGGIEVYGTPPGGTIPRPPISSFFLPRPRPRPPQQLRRPSSGRPRGIGTPMCDLIRPPPRPLRNRRSDVRWRTIRPEVAGRDPQ